VSRKPASALERYLAHLVNERRLSAHTVAAYARDNASLAALAGERDLDSLASPDIRRFIAMLHSQGLSPRSLGRTLSSWRGFYEWRIREKAIASNPCAGVRSPKMAKPLPGMLSPEDAIRLVTHDEPDSPFAVRDRALFELIYSSGLRVSEITGTDVNAIDLDEAQVRVLGKGAKTRIVPVGQGAIDALARWLPERAKRAAPGEAALFVDAKGKRITPRQVQVLIKARAAAAGIDVDVHPHMLRHSFASHVLQSSGDLRAVQEMLGHASIASTQVYTHLDFQHLAKVYDAAHPRARKKAK